MFLVFFVGQTDLPAQTVTNKMFDFDGDGKTDFTVRRDSDHIFYTLQSSDSQPKYQQWGLGLDFDRTAIGDFDGDSKADVGIYRLGVSDGDQNVFYILRSSDNTLQVQPWGICCNDSVVAGDYDGDGKSDFAVMRTGTPFVTPAVWYIRQSSNGGLRAVQFGISGDGVEFGDAAVPNDYDGDGKTDIAVYRIDIRQTPTIPDRNTYYVLRSSNNSVQSQQLGNYETDYSTTGDFDGDGKADFAFWNGFGEGTSGDWTILQSSTGTLIVEHWGIGNDDTPVQKDYDGDGKTDLAVRRSDGTFYIRRSSDNQLQVVRWGLSDDFPIAYIGNA